MLTVFEGTRQSYKIANVLVLRPRGFLHGLLVQESTKVREASQLFLEPQFCQNFEGIS